MMYSENESQITIDDNPKRRNKKIGLLLGLAVFFAYLSFLPSFLSYRLLHQALLGNTMLLIVSNFISLVFSLIASVSAIRKSSKKECLAFVIVKILMLPYLLATIGAGFFATIILMIVPFMGGPFLLWLMPFTMALSGGIISTLIVFAFLLSITTSLPMIVMDWRLVNNTKPPRILLVVFDFMVATALWRITSYFMRGGDSLTSDVIILVLLFIAILFLVGFNVLMFKSKKIGRRVLNTIFMLLFPMDVITAPFIYWSWFKKEERG